MTTPLTNVLPPSTAPREQIPLQAPRAPLTFLGLLTLAPLSVALTSIAVIQRHLPLTTGLVLVATLLPVLNLIRLIRRRLVVTVAGVEYSHLFRRCIVPWDQVLAVGGPLERFRPDSAPSRLWVITRSNRIPLDLDPYAFVWLRERLRHECPRATLLDPIRGLVRFHDARRPTAGPDSAVVQLLRWEIRRRTMRLVLVLAAVGGVSAFAVAVLVESPANAIRVCWVSLPLVVMIADLIRSSRILRHLRRMHGRLVRK